MKQIKETPYLRVPALKAVVKYFPKDGGITVNKLYGLIIQDSEFDVMYKHSVKNMCIRMTNKGHMIEGKITENGREANFYTALCDLDVLWDEAKETRSEQISKTGYVRKDHAAAAKKRLADHQRALALLNLKRTG